jgi:hypothetical protein
VTDYLITALSPVLIMFMVGSFVFFLVEVLYEGEYTGRLLYTVFFFVVGTVLIARISIEFGGGRAGIYALALGTVTWLALQAYIPSPHPSSAIGRGLTHLGLLLLIWWCAHKLTWDCTYLDERQRGTGRGILAAAGWTTEGSAPASSSATAAAGWTTEGSARGASSATEHSYSATSTSGSLPRPEQNPDPRTTGEQDRGVPTRETSSSKRRRRSPKGDSRLWAWIEAYQKHREQQQKRPRTPGVWVLYCFLAALPIFALGQSLIDPADGERRRATFWQMAIFTASALCLLATTSLLGLRRYIRQRRARIPVALSGGWLLLAGGLVLLFLVLGAVLPRPHSETPWFGWQRVGSSTREASRVAVLKDAAGRGEGAAGRQVQSGDGPASSASSEKKTAGANPSHSSSAGGKTSNTSSSSAGGKTSSTSHSASSDRAGSDEKSSSGGPAASSHPRDTSGRQVNPTDRSDSANPLESVLTSDRQRGNTKGDPQGWSSSASNPLSHLSPPLARVAGLARWLVFALVVVGVVLVVLWAILRGLAPFTAWANRWLQALQQWWARRWWNRSHSGTTSGAEPMASKPRRPPPTTSFSNPYEDGSAYQRDLRELVDYTLLAWEAWAWEQGCPRADSQTAWEFLEQLQVQLPEAAETLQKFAALHAQVVYADKPVSPRPAHATLRQVWEAFGALLAATPVASN